MRTSVRGRVHGTAPCGRCGSCTRAWPASGRFADQGGGSHSAPPPRSFLPRQPAFECSSSCRRSTPEVIEEWTTDSTNGEEASDVVSHLEGSNVAHQPGGRRSTTLAEDGDSRSTLRIGVLTLPCWGILVCTNVSVYVSGYIVSCVLTTEMGRIVARTVLSTTR